MAVGSVQLCMPVDMMCEYRVQLPQNQVSVVLPRIFSYTFHLEWKFLSILSKMLGIKILAPRPILGFTYRS